MSSDARHPTPSSSSASRSSLPRLPSEHFEQETWINFLRTAGGTVPTEPPSLADRKRRHVETSPERRYPTYNPFATERRPPNILGRGRFPESSRDPPATAFAPFPSMQRPTPPHVIGYTVGIREDPDLLPRRRESDMMLPPWQPDSDVSKCPVCNTEFSFWYRKHHCRKCGRVVCAACSPHRITIPRQYIVQPPAWREDEDTETENEQYTNPALGGGEIVRVCNPCVPDPWTPNSTQGEETQGSPSVIRWLGSREYATPNHGALGSWEAFADSQARGHQFPHSEAQLAPSRQRRMPSHSYPAPPTSIANYQTPIMPYPRPDVHRHEIPHPLPPVPPRFSSHPNVSSSYPARHGISTTISGPGGQQQPLATRVHRRSLAHPAPAPAPRRQIREEDECPVCGTELPALPAGEAQREAHIQECIATRFSSTPAQVGSLSTPVAHSITDGRSAAPSSPDVHAQSRPRASSYRPRGMAVYKATEKDCSNADGEPQECVICFEEFQPGDDLGRMECLCKFHRLCIRQWWETKGQGSCPTHQLHES